MPERMKRQVTHSHRCQYGQRHSTGPGPIWTSGRQVVRWTTTGGAYCSDTWAAAMCVRHAMRAVFRYSRIVAALATRARPDTLLAAAGRCSPWYASNRGLLHFALRVLRSKFPHCRSARDGRSASCSAQLRSGPLQHLRLPPPGHARQGVGLMAGVCVLRFAMPQRTSAPYNFA